MASTALLFLFVITASGAAMVAKPYPIARISEQLDAVGSTTPPEEVEPADWNVFVTRIVGALFLVLGLSLAYEFFPF